jgi:L-fuconolactonase
MSAASGVSTPRVDAHHHVWQLARGDYGWLTPDLSAIYRDFTLADLRPLLAEAGVAATVLVQAAPTVAETEFLLEVANGSAGLVRGVVGWIDFMTPDAVLKLARLARDPLLKSVRPMLQDLPDPEWILRPDVDATVAALPGLGLCFDALVKPAQLPGLLRMLERHPEVDVVVDHGAKPPIASGERRLWADLIAAVALHPRAHCKLSGLVTEAAPGWTADALAPYVDHLLACFGPARLLWGSDWPVVNLAGGFARWVAAADALLGGLAADERAAIMGGNAGRFYRLEQPRG